MKTKTLKAFTLTEMLVVLVIIGVLVLAALPKFLPMITKARSIEAQQGLKTIYTLEKTFYLQNLEYSGNFEDIGFEMEGNQKDNTYSFEIINSSENGFKARATANKDFDKDGQLNVWEIDEEKNLKEVVKD